jgi:mannose-6-phosphate isomerase-like protein (cupin superfamily)
MTALTPKPWGHSTRVFADPHIQVERIQGELGGYSSIHLHEHKTNQFIVNAGELLVHTFDAGNTLSETTTLKAGQHCIVPPFQRHQFVCVSPVQGYEVYWCDDPAQQVKPDDIVRFTTNGLDPQRRPIATEFAFCCVCNQQYPANELTVVSIDNALRDICRTCATGSSK